MVRHLTSLALALLSASFLTPAYAQTGTALSAPTIQAESAGTQNLFDVLRYAYANNPTILAARAELLATQERLPQAQAGWKPSADLTGEIGRTWIDGNGGGADGSTYKTGEITASQPLYRGGRTTAQISSARNAIMAQRAFLMATEQNILLQVVAAYMNVLRDQSLYDLAVNNKDVIARQLDASRARFEVGDVTRTDVSQSEARLAQSEANRVNALGNLRSSIAIYQRVAGLPPATLAFPAMTLPIPQTLEASVEMAETYNPNVIAADFLHNAAEEDIDAVFGELLPQVGLFGSYNHTIDPSPGTVDKTTFKAIGISATIPLYEAGSTRSRTRQAKNIARQRLIEVQEAERLARQQAVSSWEDHLAAKAEIQSREAQVEAARVARDGVHKEAELGTRTILDALNADQELLDAESALVTARRNEVVAQFALATSLGLMSPEALGFPELSLNYDEHIKEITGKIFSTDTDYGRNLGVMAGD